MIRIFPLPKMNPWAGSGILAAVMFAALFPLPTNAQMSQTDYEASVSAVVDRVIASAAGAAGGDRAATFFDLNGDAGAAANGDAVIIGAKRLYDIYRALGGQQLDQHGYYERKDGRIYIGLDGEGGRWVDGGVQALEVFRKQLVEKAKARQSTALAGQPACIGFGCLLKTGYRGDAPVAGFVSRGQTGVLTLHGSGFSNAGGSPVILTPAALYVDGTVFDNAEKIQVTLSADEGAALGAKSLLVFNQGQAFRSAGRYLVHVVASVAELEAIASGSRLPKTTAPAVAGALFLGGVGPDDDYANDTAAAADVTDGLAGRLERPGDLDVFRLVVPQNARVDIASTGPADLAAELRGADETLIATDDDGGERYNFHISHQLAAGTYFLTVSHCCGGTGRYQLSTSLTPQ